jgi:hypothetical protein
MRIPGVREALICMAKQVAEMSKSVKQIFPHTKNRLCSQKREIVPSKPVAPTEPADILESSESNESSGVIDSTGSECSLNYEILVTTIGKAGEESLEYSREACPIEKPQNPTTNGIARVLSSNNPNLYECDFSEQVRDQYRHNKVQTEEVAKASSASRPATNDQDYDANTSEIKDVEMVENDEKPLGEKPAPPKRRRKPPDIFRAETIVSTLKPFNNQ